ncbi:hypothetical protein B7494_g8498 [Chlorociboria aeruginascens]|nr:hypothetical protein B7494_g8498 [Chlorociboria aeruginascens]
MDVDSAPPKSQIRARYVMLIEILWIRMRFMDLRDVLNRIEGENKSSELLDSAETMDRPQEDGGRIPTLEIKPRMPNMERMERFDGEGIDSGARYLQRLGMVFESAGFDEPFPPHIYLKGLNLMLTGDAAEWADTTEKVKTLLENPKVATAADMDVVITAFRDRFKGRQETRVRLSPQQEIKTLAPGKDESLEAYGRKAENICHNLIGSDNNALTVLSESDKLAVSSCMKAFIRGLKNEDLKARVLGGVGTASIYGEEQEQKEQKEKDFMALVSRLITSNPSMTLQSLQAQFHGGPPPQYPNSKLPNFQNQQTPRSHTPLAPQPSAREHTQAESSDENEALVPPAQPVTPTVAPLANMYETPTASRPAWGQNNQRGGYRKYGYRDSGSPPPNPHSRSENQIVDGCLTRISDWSNPASVTYNNLGHKSGICRDTSREPCETWWLRKTTPLQRDSVDVQRTHVSYAPSHGTPPQSVASELNNIPVHANRVGQIQAFNKQESVPHIPLSEFTSEPIVTSGQGPRSNTVDLVGGLENEVVEVINSTVQYGGFNSRENPHVPQKRMRTLDNEEEEEEEETSHEGGRDDARRIKAAHKKRRHRELRQINAQTWEGPLDYKKLIRQIEVRTDLFTFCQASPDGPKNLMVQQIGADVVDVRALHAGDEDDSTGVEEPRVAAISTRELSSLMQQEPVHVKFMQPAPARLKVQSKAYRIPASVLTKSGDLIIAVHLNPEHVQADQGSDVNFITRPMVRVLNLQEELLSDRGFIDLSMRTTGGQSTLSPTMSQWWSLLKESEK